MSEKEILALDLMIESVIEANHELRNHAREQDCLEELMVWRQKMLTLLYEYHKDARAKQKQSQV